MNILLSNDDGYQAQGLITLIQNLSEFAKVTAVAPESNRSGASNSLTLEQPLRVKQHSDCVYSVNGTPTDCVHLALTGLLDEEPDIVISGINHGANMGDDVIYSGTVAAAMEGRHLGLPSIAISCNAFQPLHFQTAAKAIIELLNIMPDYPSESDTILNMNVPDIPWQSVKGFQSTRLGKRHKAEPVIPAKDPRGNDIYWVGPAGEEADAGEGTDFYAVKNGYISISPIHIDLTRHRALESTSKWLDKVNLESDDHA